MPHRPLYQDHKDRRAAALLAAASIIYAGCAPPDIEPGSAPLPAAGPVESIFETSTEVPLSADGKGALVEVPLGPGFDALVIRARSPDPAPDQAHCVQLDSVSDADGNWWVPPADSNADWGNHCTTCPQRTSVGAGEGLFVFPNNGDPLPETASVRMRPVLRDCATRLPFDPAFNGSAPASILVETARVPARDPDGQRRLSVILAFTEGTQFDAATADADEVLSGAREGLKEALDPAGIDVHIAGYADLPAAADPLVYSDIDTAKLDAVQHNALAAASSLGAAPESALFVIFTPCLRREDALGGPSSEPEGVAVRIPAGFAASGRADAVFVKAAPCGKAAEKAYWSSGDALGKVLSHEIGHALGLYHSVESDGSEDHLDDTDQDNLMYYIPLVVSARGLSSRQIRAMRAHPLVQEP